MADSAAPTRRVVGAGLHLATGLGLVGLAGYAYIAIIGRTYADPADAAVLGALTSLYLVVNVLGPGAFSAVEQETSRAVSAARARGLATGPPARRAAALTAALLGAVVVVVLASWPLGLDRIMVGRPGLLVALIVAAAGFALLYWVRGVLSGLGRLGRYSASLYLEGLARLVPAVLLLVLAVRVPETYAFAFAAGSVVAGLATLPRGGAGGAVVESGMGRSMTWLVAASVAMQVIANLAPVVVTFRLPADAVTAGVFGLAFVLARLPLFLFSPVQALLVPRLSGAVAAGRLDRARRLITVVLAVVVAVGAAGTLVAALLGPAAVQLLFSAARQPSAVVFALLTLATVGMMVALTLQAALVALGRQRSATIAWAWGTAVFMVVVLLPIDPVTAALLAQLAGPLVVVAAGALSLRTALRAATGT